jgi:hypothetical protein
VSAETRLGLVCDVINGLHHAPTWHQPVVSHRQPAECELWTYRGGVEAEVLLFSNMAGGCGTSTR